MFDRSGWYHDLIEQLKKTHPVTEEMDGKQLRLIFQVELGLSGLERLDLLDEPISILWAVLSGLPFPRLSSLTEEQQKLIAVVRFLLPFSGRFSWIEALNTYSKLPIELRAYDVTRLPVDEQLVANCRLNSRYDGGARLNAYDKVLSQPLQHQRSPRKYPEESMVRFEVFTHKGKRNFTLKLPFELTQELEPPPIHPARLQRDGIVIDYAALERAAIELDKNLAAKGQAAQWQNRLREFIHYYALDGQKVSQANEVPLFIEGFVHVVGMVGSGKSTLMKLIAAYLFFFLPERKITLVVGDTMSVFDLVEELNNLLTDSETPVAVPLVGRTTRDEHLKRFYGNDVASQSVWVPRWLNTTCPLMGLIPPEQILLLEDVPIPGREPCEQLDIASEEAKKRKLRLCPLFKQCPSQQVWQDFSSASIYVTTPGAMAKSSIPTQFEGRRLKYGEFIYEQCDVIIFDEVDTVQEWFDNEYASVIDLWGKSNAIFNRADLAAAQSLATGTTRSEERWIRAERHTAEAIVNILRQLSGGGDASTLRRWIGGRYFTAFNLFTRLSRRLLGIWDYTPQDEISTKILGQLETLLEWFDYMIEGDPLTLSPTKSTIAMPVYQLSFMMNRALANGADAIVEDCIEWIYDSIPDIEAVLTRLNEELKVREEPLESVQTLALKLALALNVALLDRNIRIVFYEWYNQPDDVDREVGTQPYRPSEMALSDALPIPPTGRIFGTYYARSPEEDGDKSNALARFEYANIGRSYLLDYHHLLRKFGVEGPHVLAMSGTSWLPDSTRWHLAVAPQGILQADPTARERITLKSHFAFCPHYDEQGKPINISGEFDKIGAIKSLAKAMARAHTLEQQLDILDQLANEKPELWGDRQRILLLTNSYGQAKAFAETLGNYWTDKAGIFYLTKPNDQERDELFSVGTVPRGEIERFALTQGKVLVAPMNAIGRGYNILNRERNRAAFGAVYFLVRPMPHPYDIQALAGELNARTLQWFEDATFEIWKHPRLFEQATHFRQHTKFYWAKAEMRRYYRDLTPQERRDLAATTFGKIIQAAGRLIRGGVPFHAFFVDAKWAPNSATAPEGTLPNAALDSPKESLLTQMLMLLEEYSDGDIIGRSLYEPFSGLLEIENFYPKRTED